MFIELVVTVVSGYIGPTKRATRFDHTGKSSITQHSFIYKHTVLHGTKILHPEPFYYKRIIMKLWKCKNPKNNGRQGLNNICKIFSCFSAVFYNSKTVLNFVL